MPSPPQYAIPDETSARSAAHLYGQYRARLDEDINRRRRERIIDITPTRVDLESESSPSSNARSRTREGRLAGLEPAPGSRTGASRAQSPSLASRVREVPSSENAFIYEPGPNNEEITLRPPPKARGVLVDLIA